MSSRSALAGAVFACAAAVSLAAFQTADPAPHVAAARAAAGTDFLPLFNRLCVPPAAAPAAGRAPAPARPAGPPPRSSWHADPVKVFDNLYFVGQTEYSAWALVTSAGIIVLDPLFDYSVADEVAGGLETLGLNPADIKYVVISHGHSDPVC
jgi:metallo-beta-lactamase class B